jgi:hypothetical protein
MESRGSHRSGLLTAGGVLSIVAGISQTVCGGVLTVDFLVSYPHCWDLINALFVPFLPYTWQNYILSNQSALLGYYRWIPIRWAIIGGCLVALGILAVVGGISAIGRKSFGLSLTGTICALPSTVLGIIAVIFVAFGKSEFGTKD